MEEKMEDNPFRPVRPVPGEEKTAEARKGAHGFPDWDLVPPRLSVRGGNRA